MDRVAVFVDAGYLYAAGSTCLCGQKQSRNDLHLDITAVIRELVSLAAAKTDHLPLLRINWYDGAKHFRGPTLEHTTLARHDDVKVRLGFVNSQGQQKGVDSLIVTDLVELARNRAISDAVLLSGDEDVRIGVQLAQSYGVRVHLLGITPSRASQSRQLMQESDTATEWDEATISKFLSVSRLRVDSTVEDRQTTSQGSTEDSTKLSGIVHEIVAALSDGEIEALRKHWSNSNAIPSEFDGRVLATSRNAIGRNLDSDERRFVRKLFKEGVNAR